MRNEQYTRIAAFLSQYCKTADGFPVLPSEPDILKAAIDVLISDGIMTEAQIKREAVDDFDVIIPYDWFPERKEDEK